MPACSSRRPRSTPLPRNRCISRMRPSTPSLQTTHGPSIDGGVSVRIAGDVSVGVDGVLVHGERRCRRERRDSASLFLQDTANHRRHGACSCIAKSWPHTSSPSTRCIRDRAVDVALSVGPSFFKVRQDVVSDITFTDTYPFDAPAFTSAGSQRVSASNTTGFNVGADVGLRLARHAGVGGSVRFSKAVGSVDGAQQRGSRCRWTPVERRSPAG